MERAGYCGLVSIGQQLFFGLGAYATIRIAFPGVDPFAAMLVGSVAVGLLAWPISPLMLRLKGDEFSMGMWVLASIRQLAVKLDPMIQGETGSSRISLNAYDADLRGSLIYWAALAAMTLLLGALFVPLHSRKGWPFRQSATAKRRPPRLASNRTGPSASRSCWRRSVPRLPGPGGWRRRSAFSRAATMACSGRPTISSLCWSVVSADLRALSLALSCSSLSRHSLPPPGSGN